MRDVDEYERLMESHREEAKTIAWMRFMKGNIAERDMRYAVSSGMSNLAVGYIFDFENDTWRRETKK